ncbi:hypothetical protein BVRB_2g041720 [Beta vulgaris subsp. vulgaris]|nr:hypothetical protein BVRB_2g041720 [Beta vulgaris subsp. vulgaris]
MHSFTSLQDFILTNCPKVRCFPEGGLPMNLISVYFYGLNIEQPFKEWKLHNLNSLQKLSVSDVGYSSNSIHSFPDDDDHCLPSSLNGLAISGFLNLKSISFLGIPNLTSLSIRRCPKLKYFVDECLPSGLRDLVVVQCPLLKHQMEKDPLRRKLSCITHLHIC